MNQLPVLDQKPKKGVILAEVGPWSIIKVNDGRPRKGAGRTKHTVRWVDIYLEGERVAQVSTGNLKIANTVIFSLPTHKTCPGRTKLCSHLCYANIHYPKALSNREMNLAFTKSGRFNEGMAIAILAIRAKYGITRVRIHEAGDFYGPEYWRDWVDIAINLPQYKFWTYTKSPVLAWSKTPGFCPENLTLRASTDRSSPKDAKHWTKPQNPLMPIPEAYMLDLANETAPTKAEANEAGFVYCPAIQGRNVSCGDCNICYDSNWSVIFSIHGSQRAGNYPEILPSYDWGVC